MAAKNSNYGLIFVLFLILVMAITLTVVDSTRGVYNDGYKTRLVVIVTDLTGNPIPSAKVRILETNQTFFSDSAGKTQPIPVKRWEKKNYDWFCVTVTVQAENYVDTVVFQCVIYDNVTRYLNIRLYHMDGSPLPYVAYTEIPPDEYIRSIFQD